MPPTPTTPTPPPQPHTQTPTSDAAGGAAEGASRSMPVCVGYISRSAHRREYIAGECGVGLPRAQAKPMATTPPKRNEEPDATPRRGPEGSFGALPAHSRNSQFSH